MSSAIFKTWIGCTLLAVLMLALDCGPICGFDSKIEKTTESSASCHQDSNSDEASGCEWDSGSIVLSETDSNLFKLLRFFIPSRLYAANPFFSFFPFSTRMEFVFDFVETGSNYIQTFASVRLLI
ncbi:hypothetical protein [Leptospira alstonii]|uniref:Uncharacterized protein n=2 Tax=Leptospira alstonii TaxID=28452 RepID=M6CS33_9LEPT|nr:hypothetical protein [Leptospira alstonii]EMJ91708.1 hypothetical protein LEP1GSC194_4075 [Leptospira alstonii serovar Sichuan str. 79601]EQA79631.1 hypothetical protein LEP1GSC193_3066 [Leptospira alstonii serovar Pingchang str. 80-412]